VKLIALIYFALVTSNIVASDYDAAASATNQFGLDLYRKLATGDENLCLSPYSIESALAMTFAGADGKTRSEMARVLHFPENGDEIHSSFTALQKSLREMATRTAQIADESKNSGGPSDPITLSIANRLFAQKDYDFRDSFRALLKKEYDAPIEPLDFRTNTNAAREHINEWVAGQTRDRIRDLIPAGGLDEMTRLVLTNAIYLKAPWTSEFSEHATAPKPFHIHGGTAVNVPTMEKESNLGYVKRDDFTAVTIPYSGDELQLLILLPNKVNGLHAVEANLTVKKLAECAKLQNHLVDLYLPKFKLEPPTVALAKELQTLGMKSAFDQPQGSANFDRIASRKSNDYLYISQVFHKTFIAVDERGTEAAAATAVSMGVTVAFEAAPPKPTTVKVDHPFLYAVQHVPSGVCLFVGRVTDPR
jgi:serpin B